VVFSRKADGVAALKRYSNVQLDGKAMTIELIGTNLITSALPAPPAVAIQPASVVQFTNAATNGFYGSSEAFRVPAAAQGRMLGIGYVSISSSV
jgi:THO complex subunit 4